MKKHLILFTGLIAGLAGLTQTNTPQTAQAAGIYHVVKSKAANNATFHWNGSKQAYLWNANLTQKKHHLTNYPKTTWYAAKVLKMTNGTKAGTFYYVTNQSGKTKGYVWKGYLTAGAYANKKAVGSNSNWITKGNPGGAPHPTSAELNDLQGADSDEYDSTVTYYQDLPVIKSFTGTTYNYKLDEAAAGYLGNDYDSVTKHDWGDKLNDMKFIKISTQLTDQQIQKLVDGTPTFKKFVLKDLAKQHVNLSAYKGWQIGMFSLPIYQTELKSAGSNSRLGEYAIALLDPSKD